MFEAYMNPKLELIENLNPLNSNTSKQVKHKILCSYWKEQTYTRVYLEVQPKSNGEKLKLEIIHGNELDISAAILIMKRFHL